jgi:DNA polymerase-3 subunit beta
MRFSANREGFASALKLAMSCAERKSTIPILTHVLVTAPAEGLTVTASDLDREVTIQLDCDVQEPGSDAIEGGMLLDIASRSAGDDIAVETVKGRGVSVKSGRSRFVVPTLPAADFPSISAAMTPDITPCSLGEEFASAVSAVSFAACDDLSKPYLSGVYVDTMSQPEGETWNIVATDGHRLSKITIAAPDGGEMVSPFLLPLKSTALIARMFATGAIELRASDRMVKFSNASAQLVTKLIEASFPRYGVIIKDQRYQVRASREGLSRAVARAAIAAEGKKGVVFSFADNAIKLSASMAAGAESFDEIDADCPSMPFQIRANDRYISDALAMMEGDEVSFTLENQSQPITFRSARSVCVVMPTAI